jgi:manganese oxidase
LFDAHALDADLAAGDYKDPGPYKNPPGTVAYEFTGDAGEAHEAPRNASRRKPTIEFEVVKPGSIPSSSHEH